MAQEQWKDLYFRHNFDDKGLYPTAGTLSSSPDIITAGGEPFADPAQLITDNNWKHDFGNQAAAKEPNYIYLRGQNLGEEKTEGKLYLYASPASLLLFPTNPVDPKKGWSKNPIKTSKGGEYVVVNPEAQARFVSMDPFRWIPDAIYGDHYCVVGRVETKANPNPIPTVGNLNDFAAYISTHPNMVWRNIAMRNPQFPQWTSDPIEYDQGDIGGDVYVFLKCVNAPDGSRVRFSAGTPGPNPPFAIDWMTVKNSPGKDGTPTFIAPLQTNIPANWYSTVVYTWDSNGKAPLPDMQITLEALLPSAPGKTVWDSSLGKFARPLEEIYGLEIPRERWTVPRAWVGPTKAIVLGSHAMHGVSVPKSLSESSGRASGTGSTSSIFVMGTSWLESTRSITGRTTIEKDVTIRRAIDKGVMTETLHIAASEPPSEETPVDLAVAVELNGTEEGGTTLVTLVTNGVPVGATVWFKNTDGDVPIETSPTKVTKLGKFQIATLVELPSDYHAAIRVYLQLDGLTLQEGYTMVFSAVEKTVEGADAGPTPGKLLGKVTIS
jgi:hypothetical protein